MCCESFDGYLARSPCRGRHLDARTKLKTTHELTGLHTRDALDNQSLVEAVPCANWDSALLQVLLRGFPEHPKTELFRDKSSSDSTGSRPNLLPKKDF